MESKNPFHAVRSVMADNHEKVWSATKTYLDSMQKSMLTVPNANEAPVNGSEHISTNRWRLTKHL